MMRALGSSEMSVLQEPHSLTSQKTPFFIVTAVKTSNLAICLCSPIALECEFIMQVVVKRDCSILLLIIVLLEQFAAMQNPSEAYQSVRVYSTSQFHQNSKVCLQGSLCRISIRFLWNWTLASRLQSSGLWNRAISREGTLLFRYRTLTRL
jgi:hypothetical protein